MHVFKIGGDEISGVKSLFENLTFAVIQSHIKLKPIQRTWALWSQR